MSEKKLMKVVRKKLIEVQRETQNFPSLPGSRGMPFREVENGENVILLTPIQQRSEI
jgi:hypothetical protein